MSRADDSFTPSRRSFLRMAGPGLAAATGLAALPIILTPEERLTNAVEELKAAWSAVHGEPRIVEISPEFNYLLVAGTVPSKQPLVVSRQLS